MHARASPLGLSPTRPAIMYHAAELLACKPYQSWLERSALRVVEQQCSLDPNRANDTAGPSKALGVCEYA